MSIESAKVPQFFCRQPKSVELIQAEPLFRGLPNFEVPENQTTRCSAYVANGKGFLYTTPECVKITDTVTGELIFNIDIPDIFEFSVSPTGKYITTWSKLVRNPENEAVYLKNVNLIRLDFSNAESPSYKIVHSMVNTNQNGWIPQYTHNETTICFMRNPYSLNFFKFSESLDNFDFSKPSSTLDLKEFGKIEEFEISPGLNPAVSVFIPTNKGNPAFIKVFSLSNIKTPVSQKQFFKGESCTFHWNSLGTSLLALVSTDVDSTNKSYYGETQLYLLDISGLFVQKINLPNEGPIHECTWSPTAREFAVIYGYMPAVTTFFDSRGNAIHSLPKASRNTIIYSPHAKYILVAGFGNLPGDVDILDRQSRFATVASFQASNTSVCKWSPDGRFILTATTSPRLRVDNSVKIWYFNGSLVYFKAFNELNKIDWRHQELSDFPPISVSKVDKVDCEADQSAVEYLAKQNAKKPSTSAIKKGAYRPPHARNSASPSGRSLADLHEQKQSGFLNRSTPVPGYAPVGATTVSFAQMQLQQQQAAAAATAVGSSSESKAAQKNRKKRQNKKAEEGTAATETAAATTTTTTTSAVSSANSSADSNPESLIIGGVFSLEEKKIRNLLKKLRAIEALKLKQYNFEHLEDTQLLKISTEGAVRKELEALGWKE